jgi:hypothetical protein
MVILESLLCLISRVIRSLPLMPIPFYCHRDLRQLLNIPCLKRWFKRHSSIEGRDLL